MGTRTVVTGLALAVAMLFGTTAVADPPVPEPAAGIEEGSLGTAEEPDGKAVFMKKCKTCHGEDGNPTPVGKKQGAPEDYKKHLKEHTVEEIVKIVTEGKGKMKPLKDKLTPEEIKAVAKYAKSLAEK